MSEHQHGSVDPTPHQKTFEGFVKVAFGVFIVVLAILAFLAVVGT